MDFFRQRSKNLIPSVTGRRFQENCFLRRCREFIPQLAPTENVSLARFTSFRIGGPARFFAEPRSLEELRLLIRCAQEAELRIFVLGAGTNLLVDDEGFFGLVLRLRGTFWERYQLHLEGITVRCGLSLRRLGRLCGENAIGGYEFCDGIPGTVGGAIFQNAGAFGSAIGDLVEKVAVLRCDGKLLRLKPTFSYRRSSLPKGAIVVSVELRRQDGDRECISRRLEEMAKMRRERQPREPSAGCLFRNPPSRSAGELIELAGLKGFRVGDAQISQKHGNFAINVGSATCADVLNLTFSVKRAVKECFKIDLGLELCYLANF